MQIAYMKSKVFADNSEELRIKINNEITITQIEKARKTRFINKINKMKRERKLNKQYNALHFDTPDYERQKKAIELELNIRNINNIIRSSSRTRQNLYDICKCNDFKFFVTVTFDNQKINRKNDRIIKRRFSQWANNVKKRYPSMYYVAVPEYHKKGGLHFHLLIGGITFDDLNCVPAVSKRGHLVIKNGKQIYNIGAWKLGYSTLSIIENEEASKHYICKYITKQHYDDRFFNKRRYYVSHNIKRPVVTKWRELPENCLNKINTGVYLVAYLDKRKKYAVLTTDGNGVYNPTKNAPEVLSDLASIRGAAASPPPSLLDVKDT